MSEISPPQPRLQLLSIKFLLLDPPRSPPEIFTTPRQSRVYKRDNVTVCEVQVYKGDNVTVTCLVSGGKPVSETNITVTCASLQSNVTVQEGNNISTSVTFSPVTSADQVNCSCRTTWKNYTWYTHTVNLSVDVFCEYIVSKFLRFVIRTLEIHRGFCVNLHMTCMVFALHVLMEGANSSL